MSISNTIESPPEVMSLENDISSPVSYNDNLLEQTRTQWQFGDWESLAKLDSETLQHHPDRAKVSLFAASAHSQIGNILEARQLIKLAKEWGCNKKLISQILIAGVYNSLGRAAVVSGQQARSLKHFENSVIIGSPGDETLCLTKARLNEQLRQLGMNIEGSSLQLEYNGTNTKYNGDFSTFVRELKQKIILDISKDIKTNKPNPYVHNRTLTSELNKSLRDFAQNNLKLGELKKNYLDYLAGKSIQIEKNCVGRLATTVQDAIVRQLIAECVSGDVFCVLEIGALYGISLAILYNHAVTRFSKSHVICLDPFDGFYGHPVDAVLNSPINDLTFVRNMSLSNVPTTDYSLIKKYSTDKEALDIASKLNVNYLLIDGDHSYEGVKFDFVKYFPLIKSGGYVVFDDYNAKEWPGVQKFVDEDLQRFSDIEYLGAFSRTAVARKRDIA